MAPRASLFLLLLAGAACRDPSPSTKDTGKLPVDADGDGFVSDEDCDDGDPSAHPGAEERCDGVDNDCDGDIDEGLTSTWYRDADYDGYGDESLSVESCEQPGGYIFRAGDCDDANDTVHENHEENCDNLDNDCDGHVDEGMDVPWFADWDGDGYGDPTSIAIACEAPDGYVREATDCDDKNPDIHPGADELCNGVDDDCDLLVDEYGAVDAPTWYIDLDHDGFGSSIYAVIECEIPPGFAADDTDCDDVDASSFPGGIEVCDGADNDCDGVVDDDAPDMPTWYADRDGDRYGDASVSVQACDLPPGFASEATDCDDTRADANPGAFEVCDGVDNDCDGEIDDNARDAATWYLDFDDDGFGLTSASKIACARPDAYSSDPGDCDDANPSISPLAEERCDSVDNDCDGQIDEASAEDALYWYVDDDGDAFGDPSRGAWACTLPSGHSALGLDCDDSDALVHPGAEEICNDGVDDDCDGEATPCSEYLAGTSLRLRGEAATDRAGWDLVSVGDFDGDGWPDLATSAPYAEASGSDAGLVYLLRGPFAADGERSLADASLVLHGEQAADMAGYRLGSGGDLTGDGLEDLLVGALYESSSALNAGAGYVVAGPMSGRLGLDSAVARWTGDSSWDRAGSALTIAGDLDGDGIDDMALSAYSDTKALSLSGTAYLIYGPVTHGGSLSSISDQIRGDAVNDRLPSLLSRAGDLDGDGLDDLLVGVNSNDAGGAEAGAVYLVSGPPRGAAPASTHARAVITGQEAGENIGLCAGPLGDIDGDGYDDFAIGSRYDDTHASNGGAVLVFLGPAGSGTTADADFGVFGTEASSGFGSAFDATGDWDGDGTPDLLVGATTLGATSRGGAFLFLGPLDGERLSDSHDGLLLGSGTADLAGGGVLVVETARADGHAALALTASANDFAGVDAGSVYLTFDLGL